ncbi:glycosyltransferase family 9 protein [Luteibacter yeojuensis]|uniref:Glycosyltransferase family 9 protein n=1 Tax=Luteibacter yeojuensis TaxID=345309 RepID=A0A7X5TQK7_9GAMM|nr:glycosyltransferase family 9 protein [Luteibacter yeojuensis]NID15602.1 glycosyltransferase family 9 protein [Luteibacter yeojuensis]
MSPVATHSSGPSVVPARKPLHGNAATWRRRAAAWLARHLLAPQKNLVGAGELPAFGIQRILVCRPNHRLGNTLLLTPLLVEIERRFPGAEVDLLSAGPAARAIFRGFDIVGDCVTLDRRAVRHPLATWAALRKLRARRYDLVVDAASGSSSGRFASAMVKARFQLRVDALSGGATATHLAARPVHALRWALGLPGDAPVPPLDLRLTDAERRCGREALSRVLGPAGEHAPPVLAIFPNATGAKRLAPEWWSTFTAELVARHGALRIVELVSADGQSRLGGAYPTYYTSDPRKLAAFIEAAGTYLSADCGVMHLAAATSATAVGLFGHTDPARYAPYGRNNTAVSCEDGDPRSVVARVAAHLERRASPAPETGAQ